LIFPGTQFTGPGLAGVGVLYTGTSCGWLEKARKIVLRISKKVTILDKTSPKDLFEKTSLQSSSDFYNIILLIL
jgi:hypothetical protein